jgi:hypothetical protein
MRKSQNQQVTICGLFLDFEWCTPTWDDLQ